MKKIIQTIRRMINLLKWIQFNRYEYWFEFRYSSLQYKWKYDTPRVELIPHLKIVILGIPFEFTIGNDAYWEQQIWIKHHKGDVNKARETWSWKDNKGNSSWKRKYE